uniref:Uncharacterized sensor-like histidine kinase ycf26 n=1 Tax=Antithamnionella ternifolia TaxID=207919 RepID=A0A4D6WJ04_9FLOR|nr:Drug sensory protein A [Antithamnionella ternifolia]
MKMRFMVLITLMISLLISSFTFWSFTLIQKDSLINNNRFCKDLGTLFAYNVVNSMETKNDQQLASFIEEIYISTSSIRYILFFHLDGSLFFSLPVYKNNIQEILQLHQNLFQLETKKFLFSTPLIQNNILFNEKITSVIIPLTRNGQSFGSIDVGISSNLNITSSFVFIRNISVLIFVSIWFLVILFTVLHFITITKPINELLYGMQNISSGNFTQRLNINSNYELNDVIICFNEMVERLEYYEKNNLNKLELEKNKLESIVSTIADGAILIDVELRLLFANAVAMKSFDWVNIDVVGDSICNHLPLHVTESLLPIFNKLVKSTYLEHFNYKTDEICVDFDYDSKKTFRFLLTAVIDPNSKIFTGIAIIVQDISREVQLNNAKTQFISNVSHELRTPLCNIGSFLETLLDYNDSLNDKQKIQFLTIANSETQRLSSLVNDILDLSRLESKFQYDLSMINVSQILSYVLNTSQIIARRNNIKLILEIDPNILLILGHESSLLQVISNLLSNAIKFTNDEGQIVIRVYLLDALPLSINSYVLLNQAQIITLIRVEIIDEGIGIDIRDQKNIFDRFVRIEDNIHTLEGTGLGLSIVKNILRKYNTDIFLFSYVSVGTNLWFDLLNIQ